METYVLKCPNCDGNLEVEDGLDTFYCKYCGYKIILAEQSTAAYQAKIQIKQMAHNERMRDKQYEQERYRFAKKEQQKKAEAVRKAIIGIVVALAVVLYFVMFNAYFASQERKSIQEEQQLQTTVDEIIIDIENGDYDNAYIKTKALHYTSGWSSEIEKKWKDTQKALLDKIKQAEKKSNKEKSKDNGGFFSNWFN